MSASPIKIFPADVAKPTKQHPLKGITMAAMGKLSALVMSTNPQWTVWDVYSNIVQQWIGNDDLSLIEFIRVHHSTTPFQPLDINITDGVSENIDVYVICHHACAFSSVCEALERYDNTASSRWKLFSKKKTSPVVWIDIISESCRQGIYSNLPSNELIDSLVDIKNVLVLLHSQEELIGPKAGQYKLPMLEDAKCLWQLYAAIRSGHSIDIHFCGENKPLFNAYVKQHFHLCVSQFSSIDMSAVATLAASSVTGGCGVRVDDSVSVEHRKRYEVILDRVVRVVVNEMTRDVHFGSDWKHLSDAVYGEGTAGDLCVGGELVLTRRFAGDEWATETDARRPLRANMPRIDLSSSHKGYREGVCAFNEVVVSSLLDWFLVYAKELIYDDTAGTDNIDVLASGKLVIHMLLERNLVTDTQVRVVDVLC